MNAKINTQKVHEATQEVIHELEQSSDMTGQITVIFEVYQGGLPSYKVRVDKMKKFGKD